MHIGYARVSTADQHLHLQLDALEGAGCRRVFQEKVSGARAGRARPELARLLEQLREQDTVVVWKLDRLARSTRDLLEIMAAIQGVGAGFRSLSEPWADTTTHAGKLMMTIFGGIAEFERELIRERTYAGRTAALARGVRFGRPAKFSAEQRRLALRLLDEGQSVAQVARTFGVHAATVYRLGGPTAEPGASPP